jgi:hypothetical protein
VNGRKYRKRTSQPRNHGSPIVPTRVFNIIIQAADVVPSAYSAKAMPPPTRSGPRKSILESDQVPDEPPDVSPTGIRATVNGRAGGSD